MKNSNLTIGSIDIRMVPNIVPIMMILTDCYTYYMAVSSGEEPPFPNTTITNTA